MFLQFLKFHNYKIFNFSLVFQQKWNGTKIRKSNFEKKNIEKYDFYIFRSHKNPKIMIFQWFFIKNELWHPKKSHFFHFSFIYKQKMKKIMIFCDDSFLQFRVHLDLIFIKISRFHTLPQEKLFTKVILLSLSCTYKIRKGSEKQKYENHE